MPGLQRCSKKSQFPTCRKFIGCLQPGPYLPTVITLLDWQSKEEKVSSETIEKLLLLLVFLVSVLPSLDALIIVLSLVFSPTETSHLGADSLIVLGAWKALLGLLLKWGGEGLGLSENNT